MAVTPVTMFRGAATTTLTTILYTGPATGTYVITEILLVNTSASASVSFTITVDTFVAVPAISVPPNSVQPITLKQVVVSTGVAKTILGGASATTANIHISGVTL